MDEKEIEQIILDTFDDIRSTGHPFAMTKMAEIAAAELLVLFQAELAARDEGRVLWEGKALIAYYPHKQPQTDFHDVDLNFHFWIPGIVLGKEGQLVKVKIEELPEKVPDFAKAPNVEL